MTEPLRDKSRRNWTSDDNATDYIKLGCLLRIADATEAMARRHTELIDERDKAKRQAECWRRDAEHLGLSNRALKGQITKLKNKLAALEASHD